MSEPRTDWTALRGLAESIAPRGPRTFAVGIARHERAETQASGAILAAIRRVLPPDHEISWGMTGGGCSAWIIGQIYPVTDAPYLMLTGDDGPSGTDSTGDLSRGVLIGTYLDDEDDGTRVPYISAPGQPGAVAAAVARALEAIR